MNRCASLSIGMELMSKLIVQIYEVQTLDEAELLVDIGVDHLGSVLLSESEWRQPAIKAVVDFARDNSVRSCLIPLFQNTECIATALDYYHPDIVHFCDALSAGHLTSGSWKLFFQIQKDIKEKFPEIKVMRSIPIGLQDRGKFVPSLALAECFESISDFFLTDTFLMDGDSGSDEGQPVGGFVGITGRTCDWNIAAELVRKSAIPVILAGGISPGNVGDGIERVRPAGIDSCTCTNAVDEKGCPIRFRKDMECVRQLVNTVRRFEKE
jgi:phosphoribosylanthranilate isomerase